MSNPSPMAVTLHRFRSPGTVISRFVARRTLRSAALWAVAFGVIVTSKSAGYAAAYPTVAARAKLAGSFASNIGIEALLGIPHHIETVRGFAVWNSLGLMAIIGAIWAFLLATKTLRGEEDAGRWELLLTGQTTAARATANALAGLAASLAVLYVILGAVFIAVGHLHKVNFGVSAALFFALSAASGAAMFMAIGALSSQLMPTRSRAASLSAGIFGVCFLIRAMADTTSAHWLLNFTPLGWIEKLHPLFGSQPIWLVPIAVTIVVCSVLAVFLASRRDLGESIVADNDSARPRTRLLGSALAFGIRLTRIAMLSWILAIGLVALFFGLLTKSAAQAFGSSVGAGHFIKHLVQATQQAGAQTFLGVVFFILLTLTMVFAASSLGAMREEEATGYLDNLLVRSLHRLKWLYGRLLLLAIGVLLVSFMASLGAWVGTSSQHAGIGYHSLFIASLNLLSPVVLIIGIGTAALGLVPRLTTVIMYAVIAWSFLIQILSSGLNLSHWVLDTSIFHHVALAPAANPNWGSAAILDVIGVVLIIIGAAVFNSRDLATE